MIVLVYNDVLKGSGEIDFVILSIFNEFEKMLCKFYLWVEIKGKRGRKVLVFFYRRNEEVYWYFFGS